LGGGTAGVLSPGAGGEVIGRRAAGLAVQPGHHGAEPAEELWREGAGHAIAGVPLRLERPRQTHAPRDGREVIRARVAVRASAGAAREVAAADRLEQALDLLLGEGEGGRVHHLHAVVVGGAVTAGDGGT